MYIFCVVLWVIFVTGLKAKVILISAGATSIKEGVTPPPGPEGVTGAATQVPEEQVNPEAQLPQFIVPPQPLFQLSQLYPNREQVAGKHAKNPSI